MQRELSEMLDEARSHPPAPRYSVDDVVVAGRRLRTRRRAAWSGLGAAAAVVAVAGIIGVPRLIAGPPAVVLPAATEQQPLTYPTSPWQYAFKGYQAGEYKVNDPFLVSADFQQATVRYADAVDRTEPADNLLLTVYRPGRFDPKSFTGGEPVNVGGRPGLFKKDVTIWGGDAPSPVPGQRAVAWQYADNAWAAVNTMITDETVKTGANTKEELIAVAAGLHGTEPYAATVAMKLGQVPAGYRLYQGGRAPGFALGGGDDAEFRSSLDLVDRYLPEVLTSSIEPVVETTKRKHISIALTTAARLRPPAGADRFAPYCTDIQCFKGIPGQKYMLTIDNRGGLRPEELKSILTGIEVADIDNPSTWFPLETAAR